MNLIELKKAILDKTLSIDKFIFKYEDNPFLINTYIDRIKTDNNLIVININNLREISDIEDGMFDDTSHNLYVLSTDKFEDDLSIYNVTRTIIKTKQVTNENSLPFVVSFDKLENWQIEDYAKVCLPGLLEPEVKWLCSICKYDIYRIDLEAKKINIFDNREQESIFKQLNEDNMYEDLNSMTIFNFTNALLRRDYNTAKDILVNIKNIDIEPTGLVTILYKNFKNIINIQMNPRATAASLNISPKQFMAIKRNCGIYTDKKLIKIFNMLLGIDYKLKSGLLDNDKIIDYVIINML